MTSKRWLTYNENVYSISDDDVTKTSQDVTADVFTAVAHPKRRQILDYLSAGDSTVKYLSDQFEVSRPAISQHLAILLEAGLVTRRQVGRENYYHLEPEGLRKIERWLQHYERFWNRKLDSLGDYLDRKHGDET